MSPGITIESRMTLKTLELSRKLIAKYPKFTIFFSHSKSVIIIYLSFRALITKEIVSFIFY